MIDSDHCFCFHELCRITTFIEQKLKWTDLMTFILSRTVPFLFSPSPFYQYIPVIVKRVLPSFVGGAIEIIYVLNDFHALYKPTAVAYST